jgi:arylsulfatase A-like enzyme
MPHKPIDASPKFKGRTPYGLYGDVIEELDWSVGRIIRTLKKHDLQDNTLVIFTSDNGPVISGWQGYDRLGYRAGTAGPLRGHKVQTWEGGVRVPCVVRWPDEIPAGRTVAALTSNMDFLPTFAALAGVSPPTDRIIDGHNITPLLTGQTDESPYEVFCYYDMYNRLKAVRRGQWKLYVNKPNWGWGDLKIPALFNLEEDIGETKNVAAKHPKVVDKLLKLAKQKRQDLGDRVTNTEGENLRPAGRVKQE